MKLKHNQILSEKNFIKTSILVLFLLVSCKIFSQTTHNITNPEALSGLTLAPGDTVILQDGTYTSTARIKFPAGASGTAAMPITFRPQTPGGVKFIGGLKMSIGGDFLIVDGFHWKGGFGASNFIEFRDSSTYANFSKIQNCAIDGLQVDPDDLQAGTSVKHRWIVLYGTNNTVINCSFMNKPSAGALILVELEYNASPDDGTTNTRCAQVNHTISNNYFYKYAKIDASLTNAGDSETIRVGTSEFQNVDSNTAVSNNYFVEADGENEIITNKSKNNKYINNTFRRSRGSLVLRHGSNATVEGNYFLGENVEGTGGIRITDSNHTITNNYIQDCVNIADQAKWNNGITFIGGGDNADVNCNSTSVSNGYQKSLNINLSNNTIINTNAPLFYNTDKGSTKVTGAVTNNLIYFDATNQNLTDVISGDTPNSYTNLGTSLTYTGNVFKGTNLGVTNAGFSEDNAITVTPDGEIFTITGVTNKGANLGAYKPATDNMVGNGIGACFLNNVGANITPTNCSIIIGETLNVSSLPTISASANIYQVTVNANVSWTAVVNDAWISMDINSGNGDATISVTVDKNESTSGRTGSITFSQVPGGDDIVKTLTISQEGLNATDLYSLINTGISGDKVVVQSYSKQEDDAGKTNFATNTLDKDFNTQWTADDGSIVSGDYKGDGEFIIFDLGEEYKLDLIQIATDDKADPYGIQIWVSTTGTNPSDFTKALPTTGDLLITTTTGTRTAFDQYAITSNARYVKLISFGRFNAAGNSRKSVWTNITEVEFYGESIASLSTDNFDVKNISIYPVPAKDFLNIKSKISINLLSVYSLDGRLIINQNIKDSKKEIKLDISKLSKGAYFIKLQNESGLNQSKLIIISN
ncbi:MAG: chondroitinase-B domain-containing protein [Polaribacter sp.]|uniref:chondroitinase-B domain-containing protein n=1 Tax=Polaribacter sp. TaxID=1920175 RepID=UPI003BB099CA